MKTNLRMIWFANIVEFLQMSGNCFDSTPQIHRVLESAEMSFLLREQECLPAFIESKRKELV